jgi:hypothetical protein
VPGGVLDVVCPGGRGGAARRQRIRTALMGAEQPATGRTLVYGPANERMAKPEAARHLGGPHELEGQELVERPGSRRLVDVRRGGGKLELEWIPRDGRAVEEHAGRCRQQPQLLAEGGHHRRRHLDARQAESGRTVPRAAGRSRRPRELLEIERVSAAPLVDAVGDRIVHARAEQHADLVAFQPLELQTRERAGAIGSRERARQAIRHLPRSCRHRDQNGRPGRSAK